jgi:hypothetical protein
MEPQQIEMNIPKLSMEALIIEVPIVGPFIPEISANPEIRGSHFLAGF